MGDVITVAVSTDISILEFGNAYFCLFVFLSTLVVLLLRILLKLNISQNLHNEISIMKSALHIRTL